MFSSGGLAKTWAAVLVLVDQKGCSVVCEIIKILLFFLSVLFLWKPAGPGQDTLGEDTQTSILESGDYRASHNLHLGYSGDWNIGGDPCATRMLLCAVLVCQHLDLEVQSVSPQPKTHRRWSCLSQGCPSCATALLFSEGFPSCEVIHPLKQNLSTCFEFPLISWALNAFSFQDAKQI